MDYIDQPLLDGNASWIHGIAHLIDFLVTTFHYMRSGHCPLEMDAPIILISGHIDCII